MSCQLFFEFLDVLKSSEHTFVIIFVNVVCSSTILVVADRNRLTKLGLFKHLSYGIACSFVVFELCLKCLGTVPKLRGHGGGGEGSGQC